MKIRRLLFISIFLLLLSVVLSLTVVAFFSSKAIIKGEIGRNLTSDAAMLMEEIDMTMFERLQSVHSWSHLEIMQEARIGDVDKRLSQFLRGIEVSYKGIYRDLFYVNPERRVVSASLSTLIGQNYHAKPDWLRAEVPNGEVFLEELQLLPPYDEVNLVIRTPVHDGYSSKDIGQLFGFFDLQYIFRLLDKTSLAGTGERYVVLLDAEGRTIASSKNLRHPRFLLNTTFADWKPKLGETLFVHDGHVVGDSDVLVGYASSSGHLGYVKLGWSILILQNTDKAFLPIQSLLKLFSGIILLILLLSLLASHWISGRITKPLLEFTRWVQTVRHFDKPTLPNVQGTVEIKALEDAFGKMLNELEQSRGQVIHASKLAVVGEMAAIMAHEVRTPLGILSTSAQMLQREPNLSADGKEVTQFILEESDRLRRLVTTLLECARPRAPKMRHNNVHAIISHTVGLLATQADKKQLVIDQQLQAENSVIICDSELLTQVFLNLLLNAIQIIPNRGIIRLRTAVISQQLRIEIADNGPGIAAEDCARLFEPFFTKRQDGVGLGLTVTKQIILAHQGEISVGQSDLGGASFILHLPMTQD